MARTYVKVLIEVVIAEEDKDEFQANLRDFLDIADGGMLIYSENTIVMSCPRPKNAEELEGNLVVDVGTSEVSPDTRKEIILEFLQREFPWLGTESDASGAETVDQLSDVYESLKEDLGIEESDDDNKD